MIKHGRTILRRDEHQVWSATATISQAKKSFVNKNFLAARFFRRPILCAVTFYPRQQYDHTMGFR